MKTFILCVVCCVLFSGIAAAGGNQPEAAAKGDPENKTTSPSGLKSSPRLSYRSSGPADESSALNKLKPMLNQVLGSGQNGPAGGAEIPGSAKYSF